MAARPRRLQLVRTEELACGYGRFSTEYQASIAEQVAVNAEVAGEEGVRILETFTDEGVSRSVTDRPGIRQLFAYLSAHPEVGYIVVNELERLTAGVGQRAEIADFCQQRAITIITEDMGRVDPFDDEKMHLADQRAVAAKGEVLKVQRRTRRNLRQKVIAGTVAMRPAFGTRMKPIELSDGTVLPSGAKYVDASGRVRRSGELEEHPDEIDWLRQMYRWADEGASDDEIARRLTNAHVPTKNNRAAWRGNTVAGVLTNPLYRGEMVWGKTATRRYGDGRTYLEEREQGDPGRVVKPSPLGALVDVAVWEAVNARRALRVAERRAVRRAYGARVFDGLVYCGRCGHKMYGRNGNAGKKKAARRNVIWYYACEGARRSDHPAPGFDTVCTKAWTTSEKKLLAAMAADSELPVRRRVVTDSVALAGAVRPLDARLRATHERRRRIAEMYEDGLYDRAQYRAKLTVVEQDIAALRDELAAAVDGATIAEDYVVASKGWGELVELLADESLPAADRAAALRQAGVDRLLVDGERVVVELGGADPGGQSGLLRLEHGDGRMHA